MLPRYRSPLGEPRKEKLPEIRSLARHPWELTLGEFIEKARRDYGIGIDPAYAAIEGGRFLRKGSRVFPVPVFEEDVTMPVHLLRHFCRTFRIPPEDFGLMPEEDDD
jgi:hypothetical protein